jgi:hypothetical protein
MHTPPCMPQPLETRLLPRGGHLVPLARRRRPILPTPRMSLAMNEARVAVPAATAQMRVAARIPAGTSDAVKGQIRRLLLAEDSMLNVAARGDELMSRPQLTPTAPRARVVKACGIATMFGRPFQADSKRKRVVLASLFSAEMERLGACESQSSTTPSSGPVDETCTQTCTSLRG